MERTKTRLQHLRNHGLAFVGPWCEHLLRLHPVGYIAATDSTKAAVTP